MRKVLYLTTPVVLTFIIAVIAGCLNEDIVCGTGTIIFVDLVGGFYGIIGDDGERYRPINLPREFEIDGLRVRFQAKIRDDLADIYMWGTRVEILGIEKLK